MESLIKVHTDHPFLRPFFLDLSRHTVICVYNCQRDVAIDKVKTGVRGAMGNKEGVIV